GHPCVRALRRPRSAPDANDRTGRSRRRHRRSGRAGVATSESQEQQEHSFQHGGMLKPSKRCAIDCGGDGGVQFSSRDPFAADHTRYAVMSRRRSLPLWFPLLVLFLTTACARVYPHVALPALALGEPSFFPTLEAYASAPIVGGNRAEILLNGEQ